MSNAWDDGTEENPAELDGSGENGMKKLREAYDRKVKAEKDLRDKLAALEARERERTLGEVLSAKGLNAKLAKFYPAGAEATEEKVTAWVQENADVFGHPSETLPPANQQIPQELQDAYREFQQPTGSTADGSLIDQIKGMPMNDENDYQKFIAFMRQNPGAVRN
jgi:hypothetical protein